MAAQIHPLMFVPRLMPMGIPRAIKDLIDRGATFVVNHSGGKDSQAMFHFVMAHVPRHQIRVVHAILPEVEWTGVIEHIEATVLGLKLYTCQSRRTLIQMIKERGMFPSPTIRQCTSDLKRSQIEKTIRGIIKQESLNGLIVNCMGMRAEESSNRAKLETLKFSKTNSLAGREWYDWLPIHDWSVGSVFAAIKQAGQEAHWAYKAGMSRLSCCFCIMASKADLITAARLNPVMYRKYVMLERTTGQVMMMPTKGKGPLTLVQITGIEIEEDAESLLALHNMSSVKAAADERMAAEKVDKAVVKAKRNAEKVIARQQAAERRSAREAAKAIAKAQVSLKAAETAAAISASESISRRQSDLFG